MVQQLMLFVLLPRNATKFPPQQRDFASMSLSSTCIIRVSIALCAVIASLALLVYD